MFEFKDVQSWLLAVTTLAHEKDCCPCI